jgi:hypothetical protein
MAKGSEDKKRLPSERKMALMQCDSYLFSIGDCALMCRMNRDKFREDFLALGFEVVVKDGKKFVRHDELKKYQGYYSKVSKQAYLNGMCQ